MAPTVLLPVTADVQFRFDGVEVRLKNNPVYGSPIGPEKPAMSAILGLPSLYNSDGDEDETKQGLICENSRRHK